MRAGLTVAAGALVACAVGAAAPAGAVAPTLAAPVGHVFVIVLENEAADTTFGPGSPAPYLATELTAQGQLVENYYGTGHVSLDNYIAMVSGQAPNPATQSDCQQFLDFVSVGTRADGQEIGVGCVYPAHVPTVADQLEAAGLTWRGYMDGMGTPCRHPALNGIDDTESAEVGDQYATRHNPFMYFHSVIDEPSCAERVVDLTALPADLASEATTPNLAFITPDLCNDGHDAPCVDGRPGGLESADAFLRTWVPRITASPAFQHDGMLVITFDEAELGEPGGSDACCGEQAGPNSPLPGITGPGGGRVGAVVLSPFVTPGSVNETPYNHYSLLRTMEDAFGLDHLGFAGADGLTSFGTDVFGAAPAAPTPTTLADATPTSGQLAGGPAASAGALPATGGRSRAGPAVAVAGAGLVAAAAVATARRQAASGPSRPRRP